MSMPSPRGPHEVRLAYVKDMNMILQTVLMIFVDLKTGSEEGSRQHRKE